jgi:hypothetical protein
MISCKTDSCGLLLGQQQFTKSTELTILRILLKSWISTEICGKATLQILTWIREDSVYNIDVATLN